MVSWAVSQKDKPNIETPYLKNAPLILRPASVGAATGGAVADDIGAAGRQVGAAMAID